MDLSILPDYLHPFPYIFDDVDHFVCTSLLTALPARNFELVKLFLKRISILRHWPRLTPLNCTLFMGHKEIRTSDFSRWSPCYFRSGEHFIRCYGRNYLGEPVYTYGVDRYYVDSGGSMISMTKRCPVVYGLISIYVVTWIYLYWFKILC